MMMMTCVYTVRNTAVAGGGGNAMYCVYLCRHLQTHTHTRTPISTLVSTLVPPDSLDCVAFSIDFGLNAALL